MNAANKITLSRLVLAVLYFVVFDTLAVPQSRPPALSTWGIDLALVVFVITASTDWVDGYVARKYNIVTDFGRITDPFVDKVVVCGAFILFLGQEDLARLMPPWTIVVIIAREFLVNSLRSFAESKGISFGANFWGKQKMVLQCICIGFALLWLGHLRGEHAAGSILAGLYWLTVISTVASGAVYVVQGWPALSELSRAGDRPAGSGLTTAGTAGAASK